MAIQQAPGVAPVPQAQPEASYIGSCTQKLSELATWIHTLVMKVLQTILPCIFGSSTGVQAGQIVQHVNAPPIQAAQQVLQGQQQALPPPIQPQRVQPVIPQQQPELPLQPQQQQQQPVEQQPPQQQEDPIFVFADGEEQEVQVPVQHGQQQAPVQQHNTGTWTKHNRNARGPKDL